MYFSVASPFCGCNNAVAKAAPRRIIPKKKVSW